MGNNRTGANQRIKNICSSKSIDEMTLYAKSKLLLEIYRDICWDTADYAAQIREEAIYDYELCSNDLNAALLYLENFAPTEKKDRFAARVQSLFEVKWMIEIVDHAVMKVRAFPCTGELYASMLSAYYLTNFPLTEAEMMDEFGLAIWGGSIEEFRELMIPSKEEQQMMFDTWI